MVAKRRNNKREKKSIITSRCIGNRKKTMKNDAIIKAIEILLKAYNSTHGDESNQIRRNANSLKYLINQSIRQYDIPSNHWHVSEKALELWNELTNSKIENYHYNDKVICDKLSKPKSIKLYKGGNGKGTYKKLSYGDSFKFNAVFHEDHVIPVSLISEKIVNSKMINYSSIKDILDDMHICVILKKEDRRLGKTKGRSLIFNDIIKDVYNENGIKLANYKF